MIDFAELIIRTADRAAVDPGPWTILYVCRDRRDIKNKMMILSALLRVRLHPDDVVQKSAGNDNIKFGIDKVITFTHVADIGGVLIRGSRFKDIIMDLTNDEILQLRGDSHFDVLSLFVTDGISSYKQRMDLLSNQLQLTGNDKC